MKTLYNGRAIIIGDEKLDLDNFPNLEVIGCPMTGLDHLPVEEINRRGIKLISLRDFPTELQSITSTSEHTLGLILALSRHYKTALHGPYQDRETYKGHTLSGKTLGIIGFGRIGKQMAKIAQTLGIIVYAYNPFLEYTLGNLSDLLKISDIVTIHIPLDKNEGFFLKEMFGQMKSSALFINTSRNKVVEKGALLFALQNNIIRGAAMDFIDDEELVEYAQTHENLILTNHIGGVTFEDREKTDKIINNAVESFINKK